MLRITLSAVLVLGTACPGMNEPPPTPSPEAQDKCPLEARQTGPFGMPAYADWGDPERLAADEGETFSSAFTPDLERAAASRMALSEGDATTWPPSSSSGTWARYLVEDKLAVAGTHYADEIQHDEQSIATVSIHESDGRRYRRVLWEKDGQWVMAPQEDGTPKPRVRIAAPRRAEIWQELDPTDDATLLGYTLRIDDEPWRSYAWEDGAVLLPAFDLSPMLPLPPEAEGGDASTVEVLGGSVTSRHVELDPSPTVHTEYDLHGAVPVAGILTASVTFPTGTRELTLIDHGDGATCDPPTGATPLTFDRILLGSHLPREQIDGDWMCPTFGSVDPSRMDELVAAGVNWFDMNDGLWTLTEDEEALIGAADVQAVAEQFLAYGRENAVFFSGGPLHMVDAFDPLRPNYLGVSPFYDEPIGAYGSWNAYLPEDPVYPDDYTEAAASCLADLPDCHGPVDYWPRQPESLYHFDHPTSIAWYAMGSRERGYMPELLASFAMQQMHLLTHVLYDDVHPDDATLAAWETSEHNELLQCAFLRGAGRAFGKPYGVIVYNPWPTSQELLESVYDCGGTVFFIWTSTIDGGFGHEGEVEIATGFTAHREANEPAPGPDTIVVLPDGVYLPSGIYPTAPELVALFEDEGTIEACGKWDEKPEEQFELWSFGLDDKNGAGVTHRTVLRAFAETVRPMLEAGTAFDVGIADEALDVSGYTTVITVGEDGSVTSIPP